jgi:hypothetical protein
MTDTLRFDLGFVGGGSTAGTVTRDQWERLERAFTSGEDAVIELDEGATRLWVRSSQIAWARVHTREPRVGF